MHEVTQHQPSECEVGAFITRILVPTDFSDGSRAALAYALALVQRCGASLHLLHVLEEIAGAEPLERQLAARTEIERSIEQSAWDDLRKQLGDGDQMPPAIQLAIEWGAPGVEIVRYARAQNVDLIAMGKHGRGALKHLLLGSVAEQVVRRAPCTVLSVHDPAGGRQIANHP